MVDAHKHQPPDEQMRVVWILAIAFAACVLVGLGVAKLTLVLSTPEGAPVNPPVPSAADAGVFPQPRLQASPPAELNALRQDESDLLNGWAWVDRGAGFARIPVDRARTLMLERGLPARRPETRGGK